MENDPSGEHITDRFTLSGHILNVDDLGGHKTWSPTPYEQILALVSIGSQSEIADP